MRIFNSDGSEAEMCGNGIRCLAKFLYDKKYINKDKIRIETLAGTKEVILIIQNGKIMSIRVDMGIPKVNKNKLLFRLGDKEITGTFLNVGNPHTVIEVKDLNECQITKYGKVVENYKYFPYKTNVEFVQILDENHIKIKVWERGVGKTLGCGTGAVAVAYALYKENKVKNDLEIELEGGKVFVYIDEKTEKVYLEGDSINVFEGIIDL